MKKTTYVSSACLFIDVSSKLKKGEGSIGFDELFKRFERNTKHKPITDVKILEKLWKEPSLVPKDINKAGSYFLILKKCKLPKSVFIKAININKKWQKTKLFPGDNFCERDYVLCIN